MYNFVLEFDGMYDDIRSRMMEHAGKILEQNRRAFIKAAQFPYVCVKDRTLGDMGRFKISVVAESKSRMSKGIIGVSAFKVHEVKDKEGHATGNYGLLHFEFNDTGGHYLYFLTPPFISSYVTQRFGKPAAEVPMDTVVKAFVRDSYWGSNGHMMAHPDKALSAPSENTHINGQPCWHVSFVIDGGVCFGLENRERNIHVYFTYKTEDNVEEYTAEDLAKVHEIMEARRRDFDENPWMYSPFAATLQGHGGDIVS